MPFTCFRACRLLEDNRTRQGRMRNVGNLDGVGSGLDDDPAGRVHPRLG